MRTYVYVYVHVLVCTYMYLVCEYWHIKYLCELTQKTEPKSVWYGYGYMRLIVGVLHLIYGGHGGGIP